MVTDPANIVPRGTMTYFPQKTFLSDVAPPNIALALASDGKLFVPSQFQTLPHHWADISCFETKRRVTIVTFQNGIFE